MVFVSLFAGFVPVSRFRTYGKYWNFISFVLVCIGVLVMRKKMPDAPRSFKTPFVPFVPIAGVVVCVYFNVFTSYMKVGLDLCIWMAIGVATLFYLR